jgi:hypothetical protein
MSNQDLGGKRIPRITPHDEEEEFDWKNSEDVENEDVDGYVVYPHPSWTKETREEMKNKYGFKWMGDKWFRAEPLEEEVIEEMMLKNIIIENGDRDEED